MTVKELQDTLKEFPQDMLVGIYDADIGYFHGVSGVMLIPHGNIYANHKMHIDVSFIEVF